MATEDVNGKDTCRLISEDELRQISRSIRTFVPQAASPNENDDEQLKQFHTLLDDTFFTSSASGLGAGHRVAAWNTLCSLIDQAVDLQHSKIAGHIWSHDIWTRAFNLYLNHAQTARPKSSRQLVSTLTNAIGKAPEGHAVRCKAKASQELSRYLCDFESPARAKASAQFLSHLLSKDVLSLDVVLSAFVTQSSSAPEDATDTKLDPVLETLFRWLSKGDFGSTVAHLVSLMLDKRQAVKDIPAGGEAEDSIAWAKPLESAVTGDAADADALRAHIFPVLFRRSFDDFVSFLHMQGLETILLPASSRAGALEKKQDLLFAALQTGKELGLINEAHGTDVVNDGQALHIPANAIGRLLSEASRAARLTGLTLLVTSHTTTRPFSIPALGLLKNALTINVADVDADFRSDVFSAVQKLVDRMRAITALMSRQQAAGKDSESSVKVLASHKGFLEWLIRSFTQDLRSTASYQRHISAVKCLQILARSGLDDAVPRERWSRTALGETKWPFHISIMTPALQRLLLDLLMDPFDDVRQTTSSILTLFSSALSHGVLKLDCTGSSVLKRAERTMLTTGRADHADGVAHLNALWDQVRHASYPGESGHPPTTLSRLVAELEQMIMFAHENLAEAVAKYPMHGLLTSIRYILESGRPDDLAVFGRRLFAELQKIWVIVKPVLCNDAPEGYQAEEIELSADSTKETLSYCWRALKEASLLLNVLIISFKHLKHTDVVEAMSNLCFTQLAELRHRGAFSTVAQTWTSCCTQCAELRSVTGELLLEQWYDRVLDMLRKNITINTRRSAGLPSLLCGILIAQKSSTSFDQAMKDLENISRQEVDMALAEEGNLPQVHAMNCIKDVLKNTKLGERSERYVPAALQLAADALRSEVWAIRNCGLMLFRAVIDRLLGTDQSHFEDDTVSQKHISAEEYPELLDVILGLLPRTNSQVGETSERNEGVFPALRLLQHTRVPVGRLQDVERAVMVLTASPSWHVRDKAARTLATLLSSEDLLTSTAEYQRITQALQPCQNELHGLLLTAQYCLRTLRRRCSSSEGRHAEITKTTQEECQASMRFAEARIPSNDCYTTRAAAVDVVREGQALLRVIAGGPGSTDFEVKHVPNAVAEFERYADILSHVAHDPSAAVLRQAIVRLIVQQIAYGPQETELVEATLQVLLDVAKTDKNACEYFFHAIVDDELDIDKQTAHFVVMFAVEILQGDFDVLFKCVAQEVILNLSSSTSDISISTAGESLASEDLLEANSCNQRFADGHIQLQALILEQAACTGVPPNDGTLRQIEHWSHDCVRAIDGETIFTREAAASAIDRIDSLWKTLSTGDRLQPCFLRLCIAIYDLLNDDDEDVRLLASTTTSRILSATSDTLVSTYEPIVARQKLLSFCVSRFAQDSTLAGIAFDRAFDTSNLIAKQFADLSSTKDTALFAQEKQNLYIDDAQEARVWSRVVQKLSIPEDKLAELCTWVLGGLDAMKDHMTKEEEGPLGWSSNSEIFTLGLRVIYGAETLFALLGKTGRLPVQPSALRMKVFECLSALEKAEATPLWLWELQRVLTESVSLKTKLVVERAVEGVEDKSLVIR